MKKLLFLILATLTISCSVERQRMRVNDTFPVSPYNRVTNLTNFEVVLTPQNQGLITIDAWENVADDIYIHVVNGELIIESNSYSPDNTVFVPLGGVVAVSNQKNGSISSDVITHISEIHQTSGKITLTTETQNLKLTALGNSYMQLSGRCAFAEINSNDIANIYAQNLLCDAAGVTLMGNFSAISIVNSIRGIVGANSTLNIHGHPGEILIDTPQNGRFIVIP